MHIEDRHLLMVRAILSNYPYAFYVFGSRSKGNPKRLSDLDLCYFDAIPANTLAQIEAAFEESDLPYTVDIINWHSCSEAFQAVIQKDLIPL